MELKSKLVALIERASQEEQALFAKLSEEERAVRGEPDRWSPKDVIAHLAAWRGRMAENLAAAARGETLVSRPSPPGVFFQKETGASCFLVGMTILRR